MAKESRFLSSAAIAAFCAATDLFAADPVVAPQSTERAKADKSGYTLFNPTPRQFMRELSADRPDVTEIPYTVDASHFQLEMDVLRYGYDRYNSARDNVRRESVSIAPMILKLGVLNSVDLELGMSPYISTRAHDFGSGVVETHRGFGSLMPRVKLNLWGNDGGKSSVALLPFVKLPTSTGHIEDNSVEGGLTIPIAVELPYGFGVGSDIQVTVVRNSIGGGYHAEFLNTLTFGRTIIGPLGGYVEFVSIASQERAAPWVATFDVGVTYEVSADVRLDAGINVGLTRSAEDLNPFLGLTWRF